DEHYLSYPFTKKKAITVFECDYERLNEDNYLNDTLIDIFPKIWHDDYPQNSDDIHTFSSFFFTKLHTRYGQIDYDKVRRWTSELDIFKKRLLVVPINQ
ncbi:hypothetical protein BDF20DRAFT_796387, partial [Mycotypha africana]|uniref:uncharacterized protein n=1 Tax=Mycotypha africana TaxID=64632 RepID=UPI00230118C7